MFTVVVPHGMCGAQFSETSAPGPMLGEIKNGHLAASVDALGDPDLNAIILSVSFLSKQKSVMFHY